MMSEVIALIATYLMCSEAAEVRLLHRSEIENCTSIYMDVKLSFVPEVSTDEYHMMPAAQRADLNQQGYLGYLAWRASNPDLVTEMEANAQRQLAEIDIRP